MASYCLCVPMNLINRMPWPNKTSQTSRYLFPQMLKTTRRPLRMLALRYRALMCCGVCQVARFASWYQDLSCCSLSRYFFQKSSSLLRAITLTCKREYTVPSLLSRKYFPIREHSSLQLEGTCRSGALSGRRGAKRSERSEDGTPAARLRRQRGHGTPWHSRLRSRRREPDPPEAQTVLLHGHATITPRAGHAQRFA